jgi:hypothetical protein
MVRSRPLLDRTRKSQREEIHMMTLTVGIGSEAEASTSRASVTHGPGSKERRGGFGLRAAPIAVILMALSSACAVDGGEADVDVSGEDILEQGPGEAGLSQDTVPLSLEEAGVRDDGARPADMSPAIAEADAVLAADWQVWDTFTIRGSCENRGALGLFGGAWSDYFCQYSPWDDTGELFWLYVLL